MKILIIYSIDLNYTNPGFTHLSTNCLCMIYVYNIVYSKFGTKWRLKPRPVSNFNLVSVSGYSDLGLPMILSFHAATLMWIPYSVAITDQ